MKIKAAQAYCILDTVGSAILTKSGDISVAYLMELPEAYSLDTSDIEQRHNEFFRAFQYVRNGFIHKQDIFLRRKFRSEYVIGGIVIQGDVAELYDTDVRGKMLGAVLDVDFASQINGFAPGMMKYAVKTLKLEDPYRYFQAGVLLLNLTEMRKAHTQEEWLELASVDYKYSDQDVLNVCCQPRLQSPES